MSGSEIFTSDYAYFSSTSSSWLEHAEVFVATAVDRLQLDSSSLVAEVASNDGYLLRFVQERGIPCVGIEPTASTARAARELGLAVVEQFLGVETATAIVGEFGQADLVVANNVLAHVPDVSDFVGGLRTLMKPSGVLSVEFPRLTSLVDGSQFDTIYHEHYSYLSLHSVESIFGLRGLVIFDVEEIPTHGGSLRVFAQLADSGSRPRESTVDRILSFERNRGVTSRPYYSRLQEQAVGIKHNLLRFLLQCQDDGKSVGAYGAAAKGNTLLNFSGVRADLLPYVVDRSESKIANYMPGSRIPIVREQVLIDSQPDFIFILPWNIADEVTQQLAYTREWGAQFITAVPRLQRL